MRTIIPHENRGLNIIIAGCGKVGITLLTSFQRRGITSPLLTRIPQNFRHFPIIMI